MTAEEFISLHLPMEAAAQLYAESGLEWLRDNTTLNLDLADMESLKVLPAAARLFLVKFCEVSEKDVSVASEGVGPLSHSFSTADSASQINSLARQLLKPYLKPTVTFIPCMRRWNG